MIRNVERILKVIELGDSETGNQGNMVDENITEVQLRNFIKERHKQKGVIETTIEEAAEELLAAEPTFENKIECRALLEALCEIENEIKDLSNGLKPLIRHDAEFRNEGVSQTQYSLKIKKLKLKLKDFIEKTDSKDTEVHNQNINSLRMQTGVKLLKFVLQKFDGGILRWKKFQESFEAAVHKNERISNLEKFTYLLGYLEKASIQAAENVPLTNDTYIQAWELLKERYGNPQLIIATHVNKLIKLSKVNGSNVTKMRELCDSIESNVRALKMVENQQEHFGSLLIPIILKKITNVIRQQISRHLGKENWNTDEILQCINRKITARESYEFLENEKGKKEDSSLHSAGKLSHTRKCLFCYKTDHYSDQCQIVTDLKARREILKKNRICFKCLKPGHAKPNCKSSIKCYKCKKERDHNTALRNPNKVSDNPT